MNSPNQTSTKPEPGKFSSGLVSITFRQLSVKRIVELVAEAKLDGVEWGGDVHVPPGQIETAVRTRELTESAGLRVISYGSYYRAGFSDPAEFNQVMQTAVQLGTSTIRVWAGQKASLDCSPQDKQVIVTDLQRIAELAATYNIVIACEYHGNTLTDSVESVRYLMRETAANRVRTYWQPLLTMNDEDKINGLLEVIPRLQNIHVYNLHPETGERLPLADNKDGWRHWLQLVAGKKPERNVGCLLEFVRDNDPENFLTDAQTLKEMIDKIN